MGTRATWALWACIAACAPEEREQSQTAASALTCQDKQSGEVRGTRTPGKGDLKITEWMANPKAVADSSGEWFELLASSAIDLNGVVLQAGSAHQTLASEDCLALGAGQLGLLSRKSDPSANGGLPAPLSTFGLALANSDGSLQLMEGSQVLDEVSWTSSTEGASTQVDLSSGSPVACVSARPYGEGDKGTPGVPNDPCPSTGTAGTCVDPTSGEVRPIHSPEVGQLIITELMPNPAAVDDRLGELVELYAKGDSDLNGLRLTNGTSTQTLSAAQCLHIVAGQYAVLARDVDPQKNGGLPHILAPFGLSLGNDGLHTISIDFPDGGVLDAASYQDSVPGASWQLDPLLTTADRNDAPSSFCPSHQNRFGLDGGGDFGTPGAPNEACP